MRERRGQVHTSTQITPFILQACGNRVLSANLFHMRIFLALIISLTLAFQGVANAITAEPHCDMKNSAMKNSVTKHSPTKHSPTKHSPTENSPTENSRIEKGSMAHAAAGHAEMMHMDMSDDRDCCNDLETFLKTGQLCKTTQTCSSPGAGLLSAVLSFSALPFTADFLPDRPLPSRSAYPIGVWRPPTIC
jgi:hypothetical protein